MRHPFIHLRKIIEIPGLFVILLIVLSACNPNDQKIGNTHLRPTDPWIHRSVLDHQPRMLTLALDSECYVAYDLANCRLYKAWKGGVNWEGIVYNKLKILQPTTWGQAYLLETLEEPWKLEKDGMLEKPRVRYQGYRILNDQIYLKYRLATQNDTIYIEERPEFIRDENGNPGLERVFNLQGTPDGVVVLLESGDQQIKIGRSNSYTMKSFFEPLPRQEPSIQYISGDKGKYWIERSDCFTCHDWSAKMVGPSFQQIADRYSKKSKDVQMLINKIKDGGSGVWGLAAMNPHPDMTESDLQPMVEYILSLNQDEAEFDLEPVRQSSPKTKILVEDLPKEPGFGASLEGVHPSFNLSTIHPPGMEFKVGGLAFLPNGKLVVATWSPNGSVYLLEGVETGDSSRVKVKLIAQGLAEPLGLEVVDGEIFVLQRHELTQLIDHDGDEITDEYKAICNEFDVSEDFHEFAFGLVFKDNHFYANLSLPLRLMSNEKPLPDRGRTIKISRDGRFEWVNHGLREPNGIGIGVDNEIFITDNQGQWLPANKLIHLRPGDYHGMAWGLPDSLSHLKMVPPVIWLPEDEIANSPSEPALLEEGPYKGQMIFGDVTHGGINRAFIEKINGSYQGVVFRFSQGFEAGINRIRRGPDGSLYVGGVGMSGGWSWQEKTHGLQQLKYNGKAAFEMLAIRTKEDGFEIEFTQPLALQEGNSKEDYQVEQWWYQPTPSYGGPKMDLEVLTIKEVRISPDRRKAHLAIPGLKTGNVVYFLLDKELVSEKGQSLWSGEAWYTLNNQPSPLN